MKKTIICIILASMFCSVETSAQAYKLQSIFIYNFIKQVEWPKTTTLGNFVIGVIGETPITNELTKMAQTHKMNDKPIEIHKFKTPVDYKFCHILFIPEAEMGNIDKLVAKIGNKATLIITEKDGATKQGSIINFVMRDNRQKFELKLSELKKHNLQIDDYLKNLAILVED